MRIAKGQHGAMLPQPLNSARCAGTGRVVGEIIADRHPRRIHSWCRCICARAARGLHHGNLLQRQRRGRGYKGQGPRRSPAQRLSPETPLLPWGGGGEAGSSGAHDSASARKIAEKASHFCRRPSPAAAMAVGVVAGGAGARLQGGGGG